MPRTILTARLVKRLRAAIAGVDRLPMVDHRWSDAKMDLVREMRRLSNEIMRAA